MTGGTSLTALQVAIYSRLSGDATLESLLGASGRVIDQPVANQPFPYVVIGDAIEEFSDTYGKGVRNVQEMIYVWSQYPGTAQIVSIIDRIAVLLDRYTLSLSGWSHGGTIHRATQVLREPDGVTRQGMIRLEMMVSQA